MIRLREGAVVGVKGGRRGLVELAVELEGKTERALAYTALCGPVREGDRVLLNTTAVALGLGTGGAHIVISVLGRGSLDPEPEGHVMKLRYTPVQAKVLAAEEPDSPHHAALREAEDLDGLPVVWAPLHSMLGAVAAGARAAGARRIVHVMTDGAALPLWLSEQVPRLREAGLLDSVVTAGQAVGGDLEAVSPFSGLLVAREAAGADVVVVADGPGKVGTATRWGASELWSAMSLNAAAILGGRPVAALRVSFADPAYRHHGLSPHSLTALSRVAVLPVHVAVPALEGEERDRVWEALRAARLEERHQLVEATGRPAVELLRERGVAMETMGRSADDDPVFFEAAGAAGAIAGRMAAASARWRA